MYQNMKYKRYANPIDEILRLTNSLTSNHNNFKIPTSANDKLYYLWERLSMRSRFKT